MEDLLLMAGAMLAQQFHLEIVHRMFDLVRGTDRVRRMLQAGKSTAQIWVDWNSGSAPFRVQRQPYLMYD